MEDSLPLRESCMVVWWQAKEEGGIPAAEGGDKQCLNRVKQGKMYSSLVCGRLHLTYSLVCLTYSLANGQHCLLEIHTLREEEMVVVCRIQNKCHPLPSHMNCEHITKLQKEGGAGRGCGRNPSAEVLHHWITYEAVFTFLWVLLMYQRGSFPN